MQPDLITIAVDTLNDGNTSDHIYTRVDEFANRSVYIGPGHLPEARVLLGLYRTTRKQNGNFKGVLKTSVKFTEDITVPGVDSATDLVSPIITEVNFSFPVGVTVPQLIVARQRQMALLDLDTIMNNLNHVPMI